MLASEGVVGAEPIEAITHIVRIKLARYRGQLIAAQGRGRQAVGQHQTEALGQLQQDLVLINREWQARLQKVLGWLNPRELNCPAGDCEPLEEALSAHSGPLATSAAALAAIPLQHDADLAGADLLAELARLLDLAHTLGDRLTAPLAALLRRSGRLTGLDDKFCQDPLTGCRNYLGLERVLDEWRAIDASGMRLASVCLIDVDRFSRLNERLGARAGDLVIAAVADMVEEMVRRGRGFDRVCRIGGQTFVLFLGDTGVRNAALALERMRQNFEAASFDHDGTQFEIAISGAATGLRKEDDIPAVLGRLRNTLLEAKRRGRNKTAIEDDGAFIPIEQTQQYPVKNRVITVN